MTFRLRNFGLVALLLAACVTLSYAQDDDIDEFTFEDVPDEEASLPYFALGVGFIGSVYYPDLDDVNLTLGGIEGLGGFIPNAELESPIILTGVHAFSGIGFLVENMRAGFITIAGSKEVDGQVSIFDTLTVDRRFEYDVSFNGVTLDYAFTLGSGVTLLPGIVLGYGKLAMTASQTESSTRPFSDEFVFENSNNYFRKLEANHVYGQVSVYAEWAVLRWAMIRASGGFAFSGVGDWQADDAVDVQSNDVLDGIKADGVSAQVGIFIGLFDN